MSVNGIIVRKTLPDELVVLLHDMIMGGELRPGNRVPEQALCNRFGVSRTPLRESLKVLAAEGLVRLLPNRGATVVRITREQAEDLLPVLGVLEAFAGELACARIDPSRMAGILNMHRQMLDYYRHRDEQSYVEVNRAIHRAFFDAAGNQVLSELHHRLQMRLGSLLFDVRKAPPRWAEANHDHERMVEALQARDGLRFAAIARDHIRHRADLVFEALDALELKAGRLKRQTDGSMDRRRGIKPSQA